MRAGIEQYNTGMQMSDAAQAFAEGLAGAPGNIQALPQFEQILSHNGKNAEGAGEYSDARGMFIAAELTDNSGETARISFREKPGLRAGRDNSRQGVFFGTLEIENLENTTQEIAVAVKPYENKSDAFDPGIDRAIHEAGMYRYLQQIGLPTFDVLGSKSMMIRTSFLEHF